MDRQSRQDRLKQDLEALKALHQASPILDFTAEGSPPNRYTITFHGRGICRPLKAGASVEVVDEHRCEIRLPYAYPKRPPQVRWATPIFHPNVSFSGFISLRDIGLPWDSSVGLDVVCERLWDVARLSFMNLDRATNHGAKTYFLEQTELRLPIDDRPLRGVVFPSQTNLVRYERRGDKPPALPAGESTSLPTSGPIAAAPPELPPELPPADVLFIGEETPLPAPPPRPAPPDRAPDGPDDEPDDGVFYIGDE